MRRRWAHRVAALVCLALLMTMVTLPPTSSANDHTYFPETGHYLGGGFRNHWNNNGGLYVFGYPITEEYTAANGRVTQWFERARFEYFPEHAGTPYEVQLGLLGTEATVGRVFPQIPPRTNDANHRYFPETSHMIMWGFKTIWETKGGLAQWGYPISEEMMEILPADGKWHIVQYFERARFEYWPDLPAGERVLVSDLGRRMAPRELMPPLPPGSPPGTTPTPPPGTPTLPPNIDASVDPRSGPIGTIFRFNAWGFQPGENISLWATAPDQSVIPATFQINADPDGSIAQSEITFTALDGVPTGVWALSFQGNASGHASVAFFEITGSAPPPPPQPPTMPDNFNASIQPKEGPAGTVFSFFAHGFLPNEWVLIGAFNEAGDIISNVVEVQADGNGSIDYAQVRYTSPTDLPQGLYGILALGESNREAYAFFRITGSTVTSLITSGNPNATLITPQPGLTSPYGTGPYGTNADWATKFNVAPKFSQ